MQDEPLSCEWTIYCEIARKSGVSKDQYESSITKLGSFGTILGFWRFWNGLPRPSALPVGSNLRLFRNGIAPSWEDPQNTEGGKVSIMLSREKTEEPWRNVVLEMIGESLESSHTVTGMVLSIRERENYIHVWNRDSKAHKDIATLTAELLNCVGDCLRSSYKAHPREAGVTLSRRGSRSSGGGGRRKGSASGAAAGSPLASPSMRALEVDVDCCPSPMASRQSSSSLFEPSNNNYNISNSASSTPNPGKGFLLPTPPPASFAGPRPMFVPAGPAQSPAPVVVAAPVVAPAPAPASFSSSQSSVSSCASSTAGSSSTRCTTVANVVAVAAAAVQQQQQGSANNVEDAEDNVDDDTAGVADSVADDGDTVTEPATPATPMKKNRPRGCRGRGLTKTVKAGVTNILPSEAAQKRLGNPPPEFIPSEMIAQLLGLALEDPIHSRAPTPACTPPEMDSGSDSERPAVCAAAASPCASSSAAVTVARRNSRVIVTPEVDSDSEMDQSTAAIMTATSFTNASAEDRSEINSVADDDEATAGMMSAEKSKKKVSGDVVVEGEVAPETANQQELQESSITSSSPLAAAAVVAETSPRSSLSGSSANSSPAPANRIGNAVATKLRDLKEKMGLRKRAGKGNCSSSSENESSNRNSPSSSTKTSDYQSASPRVSSDAAAVSSSDEAETVAVVESCSPKTAGEAAAETPDTVNVPSAVVQEEVVAAKEEDDTDGEREDGDDEGSEDGDEYSDEEEEGEVQQVPNEYEHDEVASLKVKRRRRSWKAAITAVAGAGATTLMVWGAFVLHEVGVANVQV